MQKEKKSIYKIKLTNEVLRKTTFNDYFFQIWKFSECRNSIYKLLY